MIITVKNGDTLFSLAKEFGLPMSKLISDNGITGDLLAVGQSLIINFVKNSFTAENDTTVFEIADKYGLSEKKLFRDNYSLGGDDFVAKGSYIVTEYLNTPDSRKIIGGYSYDFISTYLLKSVINYLTFIMPFTYGFDESANLIAPDDAFILSTAKDSDVGALMHISTLNRDGIFDSLLPSVIFKNPEIENALIDNILKVVKDKGYSGVDIDFEFLPLEERDNYTHFINKLADRLHESGKILVVAVPPRYSDEQRSVLIDGIDYFSLGEGADYIMLMTYEYGYKFGPARAVAPINELTRVIEYALGKIPSKKLLLGISNYGYDWTLPFVEGESDAPSISTVEAINIAVRNGAQINFDEVSMAPYFFYTDEEERVHEVWFEDARSFKAKIDLIEKYNLAGGFIWDLMRENPQGYVTLNRYTDII